MYDPQEQCFVPVPEDRDLTFYERKLVKFQEGETVFVKGMSFKVGEIQPRGLVLIPIANPMAATRASKN